MFWYLNDLARIYDALGNMIKARTQTLRNSFEPTSHQDMPPADEGHHSIITSLVTELVRLGTKLIRYCSVSALYNKILIKLFSSDWSHVNQVGYFPLSPPEKVPDCCNHRLDILWENL